MDLLVLDDRRMDGPRMESQVIAAALDASGDIAYAWDIATDSISWAGGAVAQLGAPAEIAYGEAWRARIERSDRARRRVALSQHIETGSSFDCDYRLRLADGGMHWIHDRGQVERDGDGMPVRLRGVLRVIDRRKAYEVELEHQAHFDPLTGLVNRHRLREALSGTCRTVHVEGGHTEGDCPATLGGLYLAVGIDKLGLVNDAMGHAAADAVVREVARRLQRVLRPGDTVGRAGGDIFGVVLPHCPEDNMVHVADKLLRAVRAAPVDTPAGPILVTVSAGGIAKCAGTDNGRCRVDEVMTRAETALQEAKRQGGDCFWPHRATSSKQTGLRNALATGQMVKAALQADGLRFAFQPVVGVDGVGRPEVAFYECLLRLMAADGTPVPAGAFMPAVERLGMARRIDLHTLDHAVQELERHPAVVLSLNLSATTTADRTWLDTLERRLGARPELAQRLILEVTETAAIEDLEETAAFLAAVRSLGCRTALDDFGAGYLSYRHLKALPIDIVKIDGSFVRELKDGPDALLFIRTLVGLANGFGMTTVAECVESDEEAATLRREGVRLLQGYRFGRPGLDRPWLSPD
ncbi:putative bifunctional diguanylate cyclase/phosphodiesterase [Azospirillum canadense]|uniref:putative bifunctional diguanylate cyclase/phosphodiesterase n=1 Tax=Azospirillum canadense TaxID=403962 RepID=UPI002227D72D|nr:GGDEF domain-containing phosphodiesterase [Azospirillum canadense]MCW2237325.1 diguanylate cyclase (GGDEF)-like protein [Azospirillum canadense]